MRDLFIKVFRYDKWLNGFLAGLCIPIIFFAALLYLFQSLGLLSNDPTIHILRPRTIALLCICLNILLMQTFKNMRWNQSMRGLVISTFCIIVLWIVKYGRDLF